VDGSGELLGCQRLAVGGALGFGANRPRAARNGEWRQWRFQSSAGALPETEGAMNRGTAVIEVS
jgi:hypothetical protein